MKVRYPSLLSAFGAALLLLSTGCFKMQVKQYYMLNYSPSSVRDRLNPGVYPCTIRLREFEIEEAYTKPQIVYRRSPFELQYYVYRVWAVKPERMVTDLLHKHLLNASLASNIVRRFDEGNKPEYELSGIVEAIEEYDSDELWFAHLALRITMVRVKDGRVMYSRRFDHRKRVFQHEPEYVVREMSSLMEYVFTQAIHDIDAILSSEYGTPRGVGVDEQQNDHETIIETTPIDSTVIEEQ